MGIVVLFYGGSTGQAYLGVNRSFDRIREKEHLLMEILLNNTQNTFFKDERLFHWMNEQYFFENYRRFVKFIEIEFVNIRLCHNEIIYLQGNLTHLNALLMTFPLILNLSWWTNTLRRFHWQF